MKKVYFLLCALAVAGSSFGQTIVNPGMETWRTYSSGSGPVVALQEPTDWYGFDSVIINGEETLLPLFLMYSPSNLTAQLFQETTRVHSGSSSAKMITLPQDTLGLVAGSMANAQPSINTTALIAGGGAGGIGNYVTYAGGTATNLRITSVSAYVEYFPGKDSATGPLGGADTGLLTVQAISTVGGADSVVGTGTANIDATSSFIQITANVVYVDTVDLVNKVRIIFASGQLTGSLDSSTLYVDDVSMIGISQDNAVHNVAMANDLVKVYPNPASTTIYLDGPQNSGYTCELFSVSGQAVATKILTGTDVLDVSYLPAGMYFYSITDTNGSKVQRGKVTVIR